MTSLPVRNFRRANNRLIQATSKRMAALNSFGSRYSGRIATSVYFECGVHIIATSKIVTMLVRELTEWLRNDADDPREQRQRVKEVAFNFVVLSLEHYAKVLEIDQTEQLIKVSKIILDKLFVLFPVTGGIRAAYDLLKGLEEGRDLLSLGSKNLTVTTKTLSELELFAMMSLLTAEWAIAQVDQLMRPINNPESLKVPMGRLAKEQLDNARRTIVETLVGVRHEMCEALAHQGINSEFLLPFPSEGLWPTFDCSAAARI